MFVFWIAQRGQKVSIVLEKHILIQVMHIAGHHCGLDELLWEKIIHFTVVYTKPETWCLYCLWSVRGCDTVAVTDWSNYYFTCFLSIKKSPSSTQGSIHQVYQFTRVTD